MADDEKPLSIQSVQWPPNPLVVEMLEELLALAKKGDLTAFVLAADCRLPNGSPGTRAWECGEINVAVLGWSLIRLLLSMALPDDYTDNREGPQ